MRSQLCTLYLAGTAALLFWISLEGTVVHAQGTEPMGGQSRSEEFRARIVREIDDSHTGDRWLLIRDAENPARPGRMVLAGKMGQEGVGGSSDRMQERTIPKRTPARMTTTLSVIHVGDPIVVEENSANMHAQIEGLALGNASIGALLNVRLAIGNKVVRARAIDRRRATMVVGEESWR